MLALWTSRCLLNGILELLGGMKMDIESSVKTAESLVILSLYPFMVWHGKRACSSHLHCCFQSIL